MTQAHFTRLGEYARLLADQMGLRDWTFETIDEIPETPEWYEGTPFTAQAACTPTPGQRFAVLQFAADFDQRPKEEIRMTVVHELLHCHMQAMHELCRTGILNQMTQATYNVFMAAFDQQWEFAVDAIARAWAEKLPLIQWPVKRRK